MGRPVNCQVRASGARPIMRSSRNPEHAEPIAHPRGRSHLQRTAAEDEDLPARRHVDAEDHVGPLEGVRH
jgi:hypothetical protein